MQIEQENQLHQIRGVLIFEGRPAQGVQISLAKGRSSPGAELIGKTISDQNGEFYLNFTFPYQDLTISFHKSLPNYHLIQQYQYLRMKEGESKNLGAIILRAMPPPIETPFTPSIK